MSDWRCGMGNLANSLSAVVRVAFDRTLIV